MAGETNVERHGPPLFTYYAFGQFRRGPDGDFTLNTEKEEFGCLECLFSPTSHIWQGLKDILPLSNPKQGVCRRNNNSFEVQEGAVTTSGEYL
jgi:hypothetical protein